MAKAIKKVDQSVVDMKERKQPSFAMHFSDDDVLQVHVKGDWQGLIDATGSTAVSNGLLRQVAKLGSNGNPIDEDASNFVLGFIDAMKPQDATEALLLAQMAATHQATMMLARRLNHVENIQQQDSAEKAMNKLARTFATQTDTLKRYRSKGQQVVRVERVTVEQGGQAIVGNVDRGGRGNENK